MISEREKMIGARLRAFREMLQIPRTKFALSIECGGEKIAAYESGRARLPYAVFKKIANRYHLYPRWLVDNEGLPQIKESFTDADFISKISRHALFTEIYDKYLAEQISRRLTKEREEIAAVARSMEVFNEFFRREKLSKKEREEFKRILEGPIERFFAMRKKSDELREVADNAVMKVLSDPEYGGLTNYPLEGNSEGVKPILPKLIERIKKATQERGRKTELASWLGVTPQKVTDWISERVEPSGETTLRLLHWVEQQERQK